MCIAIPKFQICNYELDYLHIIRCLTIFGHEVNAYNLSCMYNYEKTWIIYKLDQAMCPFYFHEKNKIQGNE